MIFGFDLSRYDGLEDVRPEFVILNVEDPGFGDKVARAVVLGIPWGVYLWIYPGVLPAVGWMLDRTRAQGHGEPPVGYWADYEEAGVSPDQVSNWFARCDAAGVKAGYYSGPSAVDHGPFLARAWWNAVYPNGNDGSYPGVDALWPSSKPRPMNLWQFTSTNGTLDQDVVIDEVWWPNWAGAAPAPEKKELPEMFVGLKARTGTNVCDAAWVDGGFVIRWFGGGMGAFGFLSIPQAAIDFAVRTECKIELLSPGEWDPIEKRTGASQVTPGTIDIDALASALAAKMPPATTVPPFNISGTLTGTATPA